MNGNCSNFASSYPCPQPSTVAGSRQGEVFQRQNPVGGCELPEATLVLRPRRELEDDSPAALPEQILEGFMDAGVMGSDAEQLHLPTKQVEIRWGHPDLGELDIDVHEVHALERREDVLESERAHEAELCRPTPDTGLAQHAFTG